MKRKLFYLFTIIGIMALGAGFASAGGNAQTDEATEEVDLIERGRYLAQVAACEICHTPFEDVYYNPEAMSEEELRTVSLFEHNAMDDSRPFAGGRIFDLGPQGVIHSANLTPHAETGLGDWTDEEIRTALRTGVTPEGRQMHPIMPYRSYNRMADADLDAIIAYLRSLEPIEHEVPEFEGAIPPFGLTEPADPIEVPPADDLSATGTYLMTAVLPCTDCHTPLDQATGAPLEEMYLAGGQPYEGPWGIVYGANITPHEETGIGAWSDADISRVLTSGVRPDGRRLVLMPWQDYARLSENDLRAVVHYLRTEVPAVENEVPDAALNESVVEVVDLGDAAQESSASEDEDSAEDEEDPNQTLLYGILLVGAVIILVGGFVWYRTNKLGSHPA